MKVVQKQDIWHARVQEASDMEQFIWFEYNV